MLKIYKNEKCKQFHYIIYEIFRIISLYNNIVVFVCLVHCGLMNLKT